MPSNRVLPPLLAAAVLAVAAPAVAGSSAPAAPADPAGARPVAPRVVEIGFGGDLVRAARTAGALLVDRRDLAPFGLVALSWTQGTEPGALRIRTRGPAGWTPWQDVHHDDDGPDAPATDGTGSDTHAALRETSAPVWIGRTGGVQVRRGPGAGPVPGDLRLVLIDPGQSPADEAMAPPAAPALDEPGTASTASAASAASAADGVGGPKQSTLDATARNALAIPRIIARARWGADESLRDEPPTFTIPGRAAFVHHTAGTNRYQPGEVPKIIRAIYAFHTKSRGWNDIGYNLLVDKWGRVWEGRAGGVDRWIQGAHTGGFNAESFGIAALGDFRKTKPSKAMLESIARLIRWKFDRAEETLDPRAGVGLTSAGGGTSRYAEGQVVRFTRISGHRDAGRTTCPGKYLYRALAGVRARVEALQSVGQVEFGSATPLAGDGPRAATPSPPSVPAPPQSRPPQSPPADWPVPASGSGGAGAEASGIARPPAPGAMNRR